MRNEITKTPAAAFRGMRKVTLAATAVAAGLISGCASYKTDSVEVGAVPDDYRTNHPIVLQERDETVDLPVSSSDSKLSVNQKSAVNGFLTSYGNGGSGPIRILVPSGSVNEAAARRISDQIAGHIQAKKVAQGNVSLDYYQASANEAAPIRLSYRAMAAQTGKCGRWPGDLMETQENKHYANFGCAYQNNLAAQIANPADLLGPQGTDSIDAERRGAVIEDYRDGSLSLRRNIQY